MERTFVAEGNGIVTTGLKRDRKTSNCGEEQKTNGKSPTDNNSSQAYKLMGETVPDRLLKETNDCAKNGETSLIHSSEVPNATSINLDDFHKELENIHMNDVSFSSKASTELAGMQKYMQKDTGYKHKCQTKGPSDIHVCDEKGLLSLHHNRSEPKTISGSIIEDNSFPYHGDDKSVFIAEAGYSSDGSKILHSFLSVDDKFCSQEDSVTHLFSNNTLNSKNGSSPASTKFQPLETRPIYPNIPYSPYGSPGSNRRRTPLRESRRVSIEQSGSFLQLNQYKLLDQIGQGSYGLVKLAYSEEDSTHYAMKILSKRRLLRKAGLIGRGPKKTISPLDRVYREIAVLKKLDHPNVVKLIEVLDDPLEDSLYLVFELVQQGEVLSIPTDKPLSEDRAWSVFRDALLGLEYLHYQRIIHSDLKPGNLLLTECGRVKIADLGVCNEFRGEDATMNNISTAGTPAFRAPETLIPGQHLYNGKAVDIWALGATLYSLVYGNVPFVAASVPVLYDKIKNEPLVFPDFPKICADLRDCITCMLTRDPSKRITLPQLKEHAWVTNSGANLLPTEDENCSPVQISDEDISSVVRSIPKLDTLILIKTMLKNHSFGNPFLKGVSGRAPQRGGSRIERFSCAGRSNSAPGNYHLNIDRQSSSDAILPSLIENGSNTVCESAEET